MTETAVLLARRVGTAGGRLADALAARHRFVLAGFIGLQIGLTVALALSVERNGWLTYQGGDQIKFTTTAWALGQGLLPEGEVGFGWPMLLLPLMWITGASSVQLIPLAQALTVLVLAPLTTLAVYDIAARLAGRLAGLWCAAIWVAAPYAAIPLFVERYHERWTEQFLPQAMGLTQLADLPSTAIVLCSAAFVVRALTQRQLPEAVLAGLLAGFAIDVKPSNALFLAGPLLAFAVSRSWRSGLAFLVALVPALVALTLWKWRGLGYIPILGLQELHIAAASRPFTFPLADSYLDRLPLDFDAWLQNMSYLREYSWSARLAQWIPVAGFIAVARRSWPAAMLLGGWFLAFVSIKGATDIANIENASFWRHVLPALPAFAIFVGALPLLLPGLGRRLADRLEPAATRRLGWRPPAAVFAWTLIPIVFFAVRGTQAGPGKIVTEAGLMVPVDGETVRVTGRRTTEGTVLEWTDATTRASTFYKVFRAEGTDLQGGARIVLASATLAVTRDRRFVDTSPVPNGVYRIGVAANWENDLEQGDVFLVSPPLSP
ncbi:MAG: hypothetical protein ACKVUT_00660 [Gaiella sp.]